MSESNATGAQAGPFEALLSELDTMTKAIPAGDGDKAIAAAASGTGKKGGKKAGGKTTGDVVAKADGDGGAGDQDPDDDDDEEGEMGGEMTKSIQVTMPDGSVVEAQDGTEMIKSMVARFDETENVIAKALTSTLDIVRAQGIVIAQQGELIKSLQADQKAIGNQGSGRKTLLNIAEHKSVMAKSEPEGMSGNEFMVKSQSAFDKKLITGKEFTIIDVSLRQGTPIDADLIAKVAKA